MFAFHDIAITYAINIMALNVQIKSLSSSRQVYEYLKIKKKLILSRYEAGKGAEREVPMFKDLPEPSKEARAEGGSIIGHQIATWLGANWKAWKIDDATPYLV
ncbi:MAG: hypothetical protein A2026_04850 [Deltaproteobacteria bacterium RBG_19FT_COMBO_46_12]|nr:MAG: hypothetical protein A2026_04850 [Deltaproteobacteria bacterium RBG_19FT_COMBO_46_12]